MKKIINEIKNTLQNKNKEEEKKADAIVNKIEEINENVLFIDANGNLYYCVGTKFHINLANMLIKSNENLENEYNESGELSPVIFLTETKGYIALGKIQDKYMITYDSRNISMTQAKVIEKCKQKDYEMMDMWEIEQKNRIGGRES